MSSQRQDSRWHWCGVPRAVNAASVSWRKKRRTAGSPPEPEVSKARALAHVDRYTLQSTVGRASDATRQYRVEMKVLHISGQEWLRLLIPGSESREVTLGSIVPLSTTFINSQPLGSHRERRVQSVYKEGRSVELLRYIFSAP